MCVQMLSVMLLCFSSTGHIEGLPLEGKEKPKPINVFRESLVIQKNAQLVSQLATWRVVAQVVYYDCGTRLFHVFILIGLLEPINGPH